MVTQPPGQPPAADPAVPTPPVVSPTDPVAPVAPTPPPKRARPFAEPGVPARRPGAERPPPTKARDITPGAQILQVHTVVEVRQTTEQVTVVTDDGQTANYNPTDALVIWEANTFPPVP